MRTRSIIAVAAVVFLFAACSKETDIAGRWQNADGSTLELKGDSIAVMGQNGLEANVQGTYWTSEDTVWVKSVHDPNAGIDLYNLFTFYYDRDSLFLVSISLYRDGDYQTLKADEFARRLGKTPAEMAFVRAKETAP